jgi:two-component system OmpR family sensor kinase
MKVVMGSLRWRIFLIFFFLSALLYGISSFILFNRVESRLVTNRLIQMEEIVFWALNHTEPEETLRANDINQLAGRLSITPAPDFSFYLLGTNGELVRPLGQGKTQFIKATLSPVQFSSISIEDEPVKFIVRADGDRFRTLTSIWPVLNDEGILIGAIQSEVLLDEADVTLSRLGLSLLLGYSGLFVLTNLLLFFLTGTVLKPLHNITSAARSIGNGTFDHRIPVPRVKDETYHTAVAFNKMVDSLQAHISLERDSQLKMRQFLTDTSHELRSPVTVLKGYIDVLRRGAKDNPEQLENALEAMHTTVNRMTRLTSDMMNLGKIEFEPKFHIEVVELNRLCRSTVDTAQVMAGSRQLEFQPGPTTMIQGDKQLLEQALWNLLENSVQHTTLQGRITVGVSRHGEGAHITVQDNGEGIAAEHLPKIFERFYRVDTERPGGSGLGLAIVKAIVEAHNGGIAIKSNPGYGTTVTVILPVIA